MLGDIIFLFILCTNWRIKIGKFEIDGYFSLLQIMKLNLVIKLQKRKILKIEITWIRHIYKTSLTANNKNIIETQLLKNLPSVFFRTGCHKVAVMECIDEKQNKNKKRFRENSRSWNVVRSNQLLLPSSSSSLPPKRALFDIKIMRYGFKLNTIS